ncbi:hypothetical protein HY634_02490 [Candidatus Uhrbacteria bacterium]|nr:hypothetical protein [Candidatus Uhrbacteria bacterium]
MRDAPDVFLHLYTHAIAGNDTVTLVERRRDQAMAHGASDADIALACRAGLELLDGGRRYPSLGQTDPGLLN